MTYKNCTTYTRKKLGKLVKLSSGEAGGDRKKSVPKITINNTKKFIFYLQSAFW